MSDDDSSYVCQVQQCPSCRIRYFVILGNSFPCLQCDAPLADTGEVVLVDNNGVVLTIQ